MGSILIAMPKSEDAYRIAEIVQSGGLMLETEICSNGSEILRIANERDFGVVICTKRMKDMYYYEVAEYMPKSFGLILLTNDVTLEIFMERVVKVLFPFKRGELLSTIEMMTSDYQRRLKKKRPPRERTDEERLILDKAKALLMERNGMSEPESYRYIQKTSMDCGRSLVDTAEMILLMNNNE